MLTLIPIHHSSQLKNGTRYLLKIINDQEWELGTYEESFKEFNCGIHGRLSWATVTVYGLPEKDEFPEEPGTVD